MSVGTVNVMEKSFSLKTPVYLLAEHGATRVDVWLTKAEAMELAYKLVAAAQTQSPIKEHRA